MNFRGKTGAIAIANLASHMKDTFLKFLLPLIATFAAGAAAWLADKGIINADQAANTTAEIQTALNGLAAVAAGLCALLVTWAINKFLGRKSDGGKTTTGSSGGIVPSILVMAAASFLVGLMLPSCTAFGSAVTGTPPPATPVQRAGHADAPAVLVASADLAQAEAAAEQAEKEGKDQPIHGLYDVGRAATVIREVFTESSK